MCTSSILYLTWLIQPHSLLIVHTLSIVVELGSVHDISSLQFLHVPQLGSSIIREGGKHGAVSEYTDPEREQDNRTLSASTEGDGVPIQTGGECSGLVPVY